MPGMEGRWDKLYKIIFATQHDFADPPFYRVQAVIKV
jgi:hypothetical protein